MGEFVPKLIIPVGDKKKTWDYAPRKVSMKMDDDHYVVTANDLDNLVEFMNDNL
jgi:hypothetical protein